MQSLIYFRHKYGFTQLDMAAYLGVSVSAIKMAETCKRLLPTKALLRFKSIKESEKNLQQERDYIENKITDDDLRKMSHAEFVLQQKQEKMRRRLALESMLETEKQLIESLPEKNMHANRIEDMSPEEIKIKRHQLKEENTKLRIGYRQ